MFLNCYLFLVIKEGECLMKFYGVCYEVCNMDMDCFGVNKCCYNGCGYECMKFINLSWCVYKNCIYNVGECMFKDDCMICLC